MGRNRNPGSDSPIFTIQARPEEHDAVVDRQGQLAKVFLSRPCATCIKNGEVTMYCDVCNGLGVVYFFQSEKEIFEEDSKHYGQNVLYPFWTPITKVVKVQRKLSEVQGGNLNYKVTNFTDNEIYIDGAPVPRHYDILQCTYRYKNLIPYEDTIEFTGGNIISLYLNLPIQVRRSNAYHVMGDIAKILEVRNITKDEDYTNFVSGFKQKIFFDLNQISTLESGDEIYCKIEYYEPDKIAIREIDITEAKEKWGDDVIEGSVEVTSMSNVYLKEGDVITFPITLLMKSVSIPRTNKPYDELPDFDVVEVVENIIDEDGNIYTKDNFEIREYNNLHWKGPSIPPSGKKYSAVYSYSLSYIVYKGRVKQITNEDQRFPRSCLVRVYNKLIAKEMVIRNV